MSRSYDIDHDAAQAVAKFRAIMALTTGTFDDPFLLGVGALPTDFREGVLHILHHDNLPDPQEVDQLVEEGFTVGVRDPRLNTRYTGKFMVAESYEDDETPTEDGSNGPWCIVGDDLCELVSEAWRVWAGDYGWAD